eukprot:Pompholyxophrys_punicea_v1_NODE_319_length_2273_cov_5.764653.p2 type:complete len:126 gc:universal NODE_319_length_2273_cov_5.764653:1745-1368(-)
MNNIFQNFIQRRGCRVNISQSTYLSKLRRNFLPIGMFKSELKTLGQIHTLIFDFSFPMHLVHNRHIDFAENLLAFQQERKLVFRDSFRMISDLCQQVIANLIQVFLKKFDKITKIFIYSDTVTKI